MTSLLERPSQDRRTRARPSAAPPQRRSALAGSVRVAALIVASILPFGRVFVTGDWFVPLLLAGLLPVAVSYVTRRLRVTWWVAIVALGIAWLWYVAITLLPSTLWAGIVPTPTTARVAIQAAVIAIERIAVLPAPVYPEIPLLLLAISGVWWVSTSIDILALRLDSPGKAIICAATLWVVPLAIVPTGNAPWVLAAPLLLASAAVMLARSERDVVRWGPLIAPASETGSTVRSPRQQTAAVLSMCALIVGVVIASMLPGFGQPPWYELRGRATTTLTDNPIVQVRTNLVASDTGAVFRVRSPEPVYLRSTALDEYSDTETWKTSGITPRPLDGERVPGGRFTNQRSEITVEVEDLDGGVLVPAPTGAVRFEAPDGIAPNYDQRTSTFTFGDDRLQTGQSYTIVTSASQFDAETAAALDTPAAARLTALPEQVPPEVEQLAQTIIDDASATTPFLQALAIQNELRTWEYSLRPPPGHSGVAMRTFLEQRIGYCEQFAATMAVMLRTLDIPSRVATGFTPGTVDPDDPTLWTVSWANAHAWVEVKFGGEWVAFEPTPRSDGNVLVPSVSDISPNQTAQAPTATSPEGSPASTGDDEFNIFDEREALRNRANSVGSGSGTVLSTSATEVSRRLSDPTVITTTLLVIVAALLLLVLLGRRASNAESPAERIFAVRERIGRIGLGLGVPAPSWETDREYLRRLAHDSRSGDDLAAAVTTARYAPSVSDDVAQRAEQAADELADELLDGRPAWRRALIRARGDAATGWQRLRAAIRRSQ